MPMTDECPRCGETENVKHRPDGSHDCMNCHWCWGDEFGQYENESKEVMSQMKIELVNEETGETTEVSNQASANALIENGPWEPKDDSGITTTDSDTSSGDGAEASPVMGDEPDSLESWAKSGNYLGAENCEEGDIITIAGFSGMESYQDSDDEYPIFEAKHDGEDALLRVNKQNANNIANAFGWKPEDWIGKQVKVTQIVEYPNLGNKGLLLKPVTD